MCVVRARIVEKKGNALRFLFVLLVVLGLSDAVQADHRHDHGVAYDAFQKGDYETALAEWTYLAERGSRNAQYNLGMMYAQGQGVPQNFAEAFRWYMMAAEQGDIEAQRSVSAMYASGLGVEHDHEKAYLWFLIATDVRRPASRFIRERARDELKDVIGHIQADLTPAQRTTIQAQAREWKPKSHSPK